MSMGGGGMRGRGPGGAGGGGMGGMGGSFGGRGGPPGGGRGVSVGFGSPAPAPAKESAVAYVTERDFEHEILDSELPVLLEFTADWCGPCKTIAPEVDAFAKEMAGKVKVLKVDIDKSPMIARQLRVQSVPTFMLWVQGRPVDGAVGAIKKAQMRAMVEPFLPRAEGALKAPELAELLKTGGVVPVDTREKAAYDRAHLPGARHLALEEIESRLAELHMMPGQPVLYCRSGDKTKELATRLAEQGAPVAFLDGGLLAWESEGFPVERP